MRLFKKLGLFAFMTFLMVGVASTLGFSSPNKSYNTAENNVQTVAKAQHFFGGQTRAATIDPNEKQYVLDSFVTCEYSKLAYSNLSVYLTAKLKTDSYEPFALGYYNADNYLPATVELKVQDQDGNVIDKVYSGTIGRGSNKNELNILSANHQNEITLEVSVEIPAHTTVVKDSVVLKNIFYVATTEIRDEDNNFVRREENIVLDYTFEKKIAARKSLQTTTFDSFGVFTPKSITKYCGYYAIAFDFDNVLEIDEYLEMNKYLNPIFSSGNNATNVDNLKNGKTYVSTRIILTKNTSNCIVTDLQGNTHVIAAVPANHSTTYGVSNVVFNVPIGDLDGITSFRLQKPMLTVSVITKETNKEVASSSFSFRFGDVDCGFDTIQDTKGNVVVTGKEVTQIDADVIAIIVFAVISVLVAASAVLMYFYKKNKYQNDEFKRMDTPAYIKTSIIAYFFFVIAGLDIYYLVMRVNALNNSELFANPVDVIVIVFTLAAFLLGCYFIKKYYILAKETIEKNRRERLNLNTKTEEDSGTISAEFVKKEPTSEAKENN